MEKIEIQNPMLTKSNYLCGLECTKLLWITKNDKLRIPEPTEMEKARFKEGYLIEELAQNLFTEKMDLSELDFEEQIEETKRLLKKRVILFQASFLNDDLYSRADILFPVEKDKWDIIEIKSSTEIKNTHLNDLSFQKYVYEKSGIKIRKCIVMHVNPEYIRQGNLEPNEFLMQTDISEKVEEVTSGIEERIENMLEIIKGECPDFLIDDLKTMEYNNLVKDEFMNSLPENNIFQFRYLFTKKAVELYKEGIVKMVEVPDSFKLSDKQKIQKILAKNGGKHIDKKQIKHFLDNLQYPLYYLDFETINTAIPKFDNSKPYQQIPFQFSLHIQEKPEGELKHIVFLANGTSDPRPKFFQALKDNLRDKGDILVYNQRFEKMVFSEGAESFPEFLDWHDKNILPRIKDLMEVFDKFYYYDQKQKGSVSIKYVLPLLSDLSYDELEIHKGDLASSEFERVTYGNVSDEERERVRQALEEYCKLDTLAEVEIVKGLRNCV
ncbi:DUF2779 domain-containing protein [Candidatus Pacearchaeota archaeon]|nr:DUF2779 domain-containing protein [Candidatus Pacearchaeota archaeon]